MMREFAGGTIVSVKRYSRKWSWELPVEDKTKLDNMTQRAIYAGNSGFGYDVKRWRFRYRVNVYRKAPLLALTGPMGRMICQP